MIYWWLVVVVALLSFALTAGLRRYALARSIIDIPNDRSSHWSLLPEVAVLPLSSRSC